MKKIIILTAYNYSKALKKLSNKNSEIYCVA